MNLCELLDRAKAAHVNIELEGDTTLRLRAPKAPPARLLEELDAHKPTLFGLPTRRAPTRGSGGSGRGDALAAAFERFGQPQGWLTERVREARS